MRTTFNAATHAWRFGNRFELAVPLARRGRLWRTSAIYGLCGGMVFAALDYFLAGLTLPYQDESPRSGSTLLRFLRLRQWDSFHGARVPARVISWMLHQDSAVAEQSAREYTRLKAAVERGQPAPLCLVRVGAPGNPTHNHQVLALGYEEDLTTGQVALPLYDPNRPAEEPSITFYLRDGRCEELAQSSGEPLRGFFVIDYAPYQAGLP